MDSGASPKRRGLYTSFVLSAPPAGIVLACVAFLWAASLGDDALLTWAWRIPFLVSVVLFALAVFIRAAFSLSFMTSPEVGMSRGSALLAVSIGAVGAFPLFWALSSGDLVLASVATAVGYGLVIACTSGSQGALLAGLFPTAERFSGIALVRETNGAIVAGFSPLIAAALISAAGGSTWGAALFLAACCLSPVLAVLLMRSRQYA